MSIAEGAPAPPAAGIPPGVGEFCREAAQTPGIKAIFPLELPGCSIPRDAGAVCYINSLISSHRWVFLVWWFVFLFIFFFSRGGKKSVEVGIKLWEHQEILGSPLQGGFSVNNELGRLFLAREESQSRACPARVGLGGTIGIASVSGKPNRAAQGKC